MRDEIDLPSVPETLGDDEPDEPRGLRLPVPSLALFGGLRGIIPGPVLAGIGSGLGVLLIAVAVNAVVSGGSRSTAEAGTSAANVDVAHIEADSEHGEASQEHGDDEHASAPAEVPPGPTPTPTPTLWERRGDAWVGLGTGSAFRRGALLLDDRRETFDMSLKVTVLTASGELAPWFGIALAYRDEFNFTLMELLAEQGVPMVRLGVAVDGNHNWLGDTVPVAGLEFWGRDTHDIRVLADDRDIRLWIDGRSVPPWPNRRVAAGAKKGLWVAHQNKVRFEAISIK